VPGMQTTGGLPTAPTSVPMTGTGTAPPSQALGALLSGLQGA
jgi:hypothetical protein